MKAHLSARIRLRSPAPSSRPAVGSAHAGAESPSRGTPAFPSRASYWISLLLLLAWLAAGAAPAQAGIQTALEKVFGQQAAQAMEEQYGTETDPVLLDWVRRIGARVSSASPRQEVHYRFQIINIDEPNALALPGGYIFVTRGLLDFVGDDDELASVMAHEVGHVAGKHGVSQIKHQILAAFLVGAVRDRAGNLAGMGAALLDALLSLQRSRHDELAADMMGVEYAARSGYDPDGLMSFFRKIQDSKKPTWLEGLFATHPPAEMRLARAGASPFVKNPSPEILIGIGDRLAADGRYNRAIAKYRAAEHLRPHDRELAGKVAAALAIQGKYQEAVALCLSAGLPPVAKAAGAPAVPLGSSADADRARQAVAATLSDLSVRQKLFNAQMPRAYKALRRTWDHHRWTTHLESSLAGVPEGLDYRWLYVAMRCAALSAEIDRQIDAVSRSVRTAPTAINQASNVCTMAAKDPGSVASLPRPVLAGIADEMERAGKESQQSLQEAMKALPELDDADRVVTSVLADLNSPYVLDWRANMAHVAALEGFLQFASLRLRKADEHVTTAVKSATRAGARAERARIDLAEATASPEERAIFRNLLRTRLSVSPQALDEVLARGSSLGDAAIMLLFTRSTAQPLSRLEAARQGNTSWIEAAEKLGLRIETQAIILRLLYNTITEERVR